MAEIDDGNMAGVINANFKTIAEQPAQYANMMMGNSVANQQAAAGIITKSLGNSLNTMDQMNLQESVAIGGLQSKDLGTLLLTLAAAAGGSKNVNPEG